MCTFLHQCIELFDAIGDGCFCLAVCVKLLSHGFHFGVGLILTTDIFGQLDACFHDKINSTFKETQAVHDEPVTLDLAAHYEECSLTHFDSFFY